MGKRPRIALYSPYVPQHAGGGERYFFSVAESLATFSRVEVLLPELENRENFIKYREKYENLFHLHLKDVEFVASQIGTQASVYTKFLETLKYDALFYITDGSFFFSGARRNVTQIQFPFTFPQQGLLNRLKLMNWGVKATYSNFTRSIVKKSWKTPIQFVHYPYVDTDVFVPEKKEKIILSVGRFFTGEASGSHCKRQDVLVKIFRKMVDKGKLEGWRLVLIGGVDPGKDNEEYAQSVKALAKGYAVKIIHDAPFDLLRQYYGHASVYWHGAGFGVDQAKFPSKVEHFGLAPLEAMAAGGVPVVVNRGGLPEIVEHEKSGFLCENEQDFIRHTEHLILHPDLMEEMAKQARTRSMAFNRTQFDATLKEMICG